MVLQLNQRMEPTDGIKTVNYTEKMVLQLNGQMEPKNGIWKESITS